jgi:DNA-binding Xre family transcriptional regulator
MDTLRSLVNQLQARKKRWPEISERSGVSINTLRKIGMGYVKNPRTKTVDKLLVAVLEMPQ